MAFALLGALVGHLLLVDVLALSMRFGPPALVGNSSSRQNPARFAGFGGSKGHVAIIGSLEGRTVASVDSGNTWKTLDVPGPSVLFATDAEHLRSYGSFRGGYLPPFSSTNSSEYQEYTVTSAGTVSYTLHKTSTSFTGVPTPVVEFVPTGGNSVRLADGALLTSVWLVYNNHTLPPHPPCCNASVVVFRSVDGVVWTYLSTVSAGTNYTRSESQEGPNENSIVVLADGKTLLCVFRIDGGDGTPDHRHHPYLRSYSYDGGKTWTRPVSLPQGVGSARPRLLLLENGVLLLSGGRLNLNLWVSVDGYGEQWETVNIPQQHNAGAHVTGVPQFCDQFTKQDHGNWMQSTCYTSLIAVSPSSAVICYDRYGAGSGGSPAPPASCRTTPVTSVFCMAVEVDV